ncbi:MAG: hypothetical protein WBA12_08915, partial [Catalinimonas sp.]
MRNIAHKLLLLSLPLAVMLTSCEDAEDVLTYVDPDNDLTFVGAPGFSTSFSELDETVTVQVRNGGPDTDLEVELADGTQLGTVTLSGGQGSFVTTLSALGLAEDGDGEEIRFYADGAGGRVYRSLNVSVFEPISLSASDEEIRQTDEDTVTFSWDVEASETALGTITAVVTAGGATIDSVTVNAEGSLSYDGSRFEVGDTVMLTLTAASANGTLTTVATEMFVIETFAFENESDAIVLDSNAVGYDLMGDSLTMMMDDADLIRELTQNSTAIQLSTSDSLSLIEISEDDFDTGDQVATEELFATGTIVDMVMLSESEDAYYAYRLQMADGTFMYGLLKIDEVDLTV